MVLSLFCKHQNKKLECKSYKISRDGDGNTIQSPLSSPSSLGHQQFLFLIFPTLSMTSPQPLSALPTAMQENSGMRIIFMSQITTAIFPHCVWIAAGF